MKTSELNSAKLVKDVKLFFERKNANITVLPSQTRSTNLINFLSKKIKSNEYAVQILTERILSGDYTPEREMLMIEAKYAKKAEIYETKKQLIELGVKC